MNYTCPFCFSKNTGSSPTGDWCNDCGWAMMGPTCPICHRAEVNPKHLNNSLKPCEPVKPVPY